MPSSRRAAVTLFLVLGLVSGLVAGPRRAHASPDLADALNALKREPTAEGRMRLVKRLGGLGGDRAAEALARLVKQDPAAGVRVDAARTLGVIQADSATGLLVDLVRVGGPRAVRAEVGRALDKRTDGMALLQKMLGRSSTGLIDRGLLLRALGHFTDEGSLDELRNWVIDPEPHLSEAAIRALLARAAPGAERRAVVQRFLADGRSLAHLMPALEAAETELDPSLREGLERAATFLEAPTRQMAEALLSELDAWVAPLDAPGPAVGGDRRYAEPEGPTPPDGPRPPRVLGGRIDTVFVVDATGSTNATLPLLKLRMLDVMRTLGEAGSNARVGVLVYRGGKPRSRGQSPFEVFPLSYDIQALRDWLEGLDSRGVDDRGLRVGEAIRTALDRSAWRWRAARTVHVIADSPCGDLETALRAVRVHYRADRTRTRITYVARTRGSCPAEYDDLARAGGTRTVEVVR